MGVNLKVEWIDSRYFRLVGPAQFLDETFAYTYYKKVFNFRTKHAESKAVKAHLYKNRSLEGAIFHAGFASMIHYHFRSQLDRDSLYILESYIFSKPTDHYFEGLFPIQQNDLKDLLNYKRGIFSVYTGYGKTQVIAELVNYIVNVLHERVLVVSPADAVLKELRLRIKEVAHLTPEYFNYNSDYNLINVNGFLTSKMYKKTHDYWKTVKWVIADEVEHCVTNRGTGMFDLCVNAKHFYGFSATADKARARRIAMRQGMTGVVTDNKTLINYFGFSIVHRTPDTKSIDIINIDTMIFNDCKNIKWQSDTIYSEIISELFTNERFCRGFRKIVMAERGGLYIPMFRKTVIYHWLRNVFTWENGMIACYDGAGIHLWSEGQKVRDIELKELKSMVENNEVELLVGTKSSFKAIDLPNLHKIIPLTSQLASNIIQQIGRVARKQDVQIINLVPTMYISCYSWDLTKRNELIRSYYGNCNIRRIKRTEIEYGIY